MNVKTISKEALDLHHALEEKGIDTILEHNDGHKTVDIYIPIAKLYIEVDGLPHYTKAEQIISDFDRDHYSDTDGFRTFRIPNEIVIHHLEKVCLAILGVVRNI